MATQRARKAKTSPASSASSMLSLGRPAASLDPPSRRSTCRETVTTGRREVGGTAAFVDMTDDIRSEQQRDLMLHAQEHAAKVDPHDAVPLTFGDIGRRHDRLFHARIVESESRRPNASIVLSSATFTSAARDTSHRTVTARPPVSSIMRAVAPLFAQLLSGRFQASVIFRAASPA